MFQWFGPPYSGHQWTIEQAGREFIDTGKKCIFCQKRWSGALWTLGLTISNLQYVPMKVCAYHRMTYCQFYQECTKWPLTYIGRCHDFYIRFWCLMMAHDCSWLIHSFALISDQFKKISHPSRFLTIVTSVVCHHTTSTWTQKMFHRIRNRGWISYVCTHLGGD